MPAFLVWPIQYWHADFRCGIDQKAFHRANRHRTVHRLAPALRLAWVRADTRTH